jgi:hypothetical protein
MFGRKMLVQTRLLDDADAAPLACEVFTEIEIEHFKECEWKPIIRNFSNKEIKVIEKLYMEARRVYLVQYVGLLDQTHINKMIKNAYSDLKKMRRCYSSNTAYANSLMEKTELIEYVYLGR